VPFAKVIQGMEVVDRFYSGYGEMRRRGKWIDRGRVEEETNEYWSSDFEVGLDQAGAVRAVIRRTAFTTSVNAARRSACDHEPL